MWGRGVAVCLTVGFIVKYVRINPSCSPHQVMLYLSSTAPPPLPLLLPRTPNCCTYLEGKGTDHSCSGCGLQGVGGGFS